MSFSMLFCIVFTMGAVFFDCKWEKVPNLWIIAGLQISMAEHLSGETARPEGLTLVEIRYPEWEAKKDGHFVSVDPLPQKDDRYSD